MPGLAPEGGRPQSYHQAIAGTNAAPGAVLVAIPYLENNPHVFRYSWFSADPIPNARLMNSDGSPTALGLVYASLAPSCP